MNDHEKNINKNKEDIEDLKKKNKEFEDNIKSILDKLEELKKLIVIDKNDDVSEIAIKHPYITNINTYVIQLLISLVGKQTQKVYR